MANAPPSRSYRLDSLIPCLLDGSDGFVGATHRVHRRFMHRWEDSTLPATTPNRPGSDSTSPLDRRILLRAFRDPGRPQPPRSAKRRDTVGNIPEPRACRRHLDETVFGLEGVTTFTVGGGRTGLNPGEALFIPRRVIHGFSNDGDVDARFLSIISPGLMGSRYFKDVADVLAGDGPVAREQ